jgi:radical SAM protein with 4Fe4S-binding SPASM domain
MPVDIYKAKKVYLDNKAEERARLFKEPDLIYLFFELTRSCNEKCFHCGSSCAPGLGHGPDKEAFKSVLRDVKEHFDIRKLQLCITGGEPLLYPGFADLLGYANDMGFRWGMTTNATLITKDVAKMLEDTGMGTVSVSIDGLRDTHDRQRGLKGGYDKAMQGIENLIARKAFRHIQVTTVVNHKNIGELDELYKILDEMDLDSWRVIGIEPMGRALDYPDMLLTPDDQRYLFNFIREKREQGIPVNYGCSHFLGLEYEREVRDWFFYCGAGTHTAAIRVNGDITACLDIEDRPEFVQGNIAKDKFSDVWFNRFQVYRKPLSSLCEDCKKCEWEKWCAGGSRHSFDYDGCRQRVCFKDILF